MQCLGRGGGNGRGKRLRVRGAASGAQSRYDWDGFYCEIICRVHNNGLPEKQKDLIDEMFNWFLGKSVNGDAPDESTIRKKIRGFWGKLRPE